MELDISVQIQEDGKEDVKIEDNEGMGLSILLPPMKVPASGRIDNVYLELPPEFQQRLAELATEVAEYCEGLQNFVVGHWVFGGFSMTAELACRRATLAFQQGNLPETESNLREAAAILTGVGVAYSLAGSGYSAKIYAQGVRNLMPDGFSGIADSRYSALVETYRSLSVQARTMPDQCQKAFTLVRRAYQDAERRHIEVAHRLVPGGGSLLQEKLKRVGISLAQYRPTDTERAILNAWFKFEVGDFSDFEIASEIVRVFKGGLVQCKRLGLPTEDIYVYYRAMASALRTLATPLGSLAETATPTA